MKKTQTARGFGRIEFKDVNGEECSLQKSSSCNDDYIWLGVKPRVMYCVQGEGWKDYPLPEGVEIFGRMHLSREQVKELLPHLKKFVKKGDI